MNNTLSNALQILGEESGTFNQILVNLIGADGELWKKELRKFARKEPCWGSYQVAQPNPAPSILELVSTIAVSATTAKLVAKDKFAINTKCNARVKISYLGDNFKVWFLNGDGKTEDLASVQTLRYHKLRQPSVDGPIIAELGGEVKAETTLSEMFSLMDKQKCGEDGVLLNNGWANIFYIKDNAGVLRTVYVLWDVVGWRVGAGSVEGPRGCGWRGGYRVFSRLSVQAGNSDLKSSEPSA